MPAHLSLPAGARGGVKLGHDGARMFQTIMAGIGGTPMPPFDGMPPEEVWDVIHYVQSLRVEAHEVELVAAGLPEQDRKTARDRIWASMSNQARKGANNRSLARQDSPFPPLTSVITPRDGEQIKKKASK